MSETRTIHELREHPQAGLVPFMSSAEYRAFLAGVSERGIVDPLQITPAGVVLDGRHRLRAARELGIECVPVRVVEPEDEVAHMLLAALSRRQLSASQKAVLAIELDLHRRLRAEARERKISNLRQFSDVATLPPRGERTREVAARVAHVSARTIQDAETVYRSDPELFEQVRQGTLPVNVAARRVRRRERDLRLISPPLPDGLFDLIYADPPWQLGSPDSPDAPDNHYPTMSLEEIKALKIPVAESALLFLWAVNSKLPEALEVMAAWGFEFKDSFVWVKDWIGQGVWARHRHELLLVGRKGSFSPPDPEDRPDSVIEAPRGAHSAKPALTYELIERAYPLASKLELFARGVTRSGWTFWGNEVEAA